MMYNYSVETTEESERRITKNICCDNINTVVTLDILL